MSVAQAGICRRLIWRGRVSDVFLLEAEGPVQSGMQSLPMLCRPNSLQSGTGKE